jgi:hypothetical protein
MSRGRGDRRSRAVGEGMAALANVYGQCLYEGTMLHLSKGVLIGFLAQAYYREASAAAEVSAAQ